MAKSFEEILKEKMEEAALEDHAPQYDLDDEWTGLSDRLKAKPQVQKKVFPVMWSHAAAVLVGVTIGFFLLKSFTGKQQGETAVVSASRSTLAPVAQPANNIAATRIDTVMVVREQPNTAIAAAKTIDRKQAQQYDTTVMLVKAGEPTPVTIDSSTYKPAATTTILVATTKKQRPQAIHLLDMRNEDYDLINTAEYQSKSKNVLTRVQNFIFKSDVAAVSDDNKPYVVRAILNK